jgi:hypothetical protein
VLKASILLDKDIALSSDYSTSAHIFPGSIVVFANKSREGIIIFILIVVFNKFS